MSSLIRETGDTRRTLSRGTSIGGRPQKWQVSVIVSRQALIDSRFSTVICAPVSSVHDGLSSQVLVGTDEGLKHDSSIHCDELVSLPKSVLTNFVGRLSSQELATLNKALRIALDIPE